MVAWCHGAYHLWGPAVGGLLAGGSTLGDREAVLDRVRKLRAVALRTTNRHEAENALLLAQRLLAEHDLADEAGATDEPGDVDAVDVDETGRAVSWRVALAGVIADNLRCLHYLSRESRGDRPRTVIRFVGRRSDVALAAEVYGQALEAACRLAALHAEARRRASRRPLTPTDIRTLGTSFLLGFAAGLAQRFAEQRERHQDWALVLVPGPEVAARLEALLGPGAGTWRSRTGGMEPGAWRAGFDAGNEYEERGRARLEAP